MAPVYGSIGELEFPAETNDMVWSWVGYFGNMNQFDPDELTWSGSPFNIGYGDVFVVKKAVTSTATSWVQKNPTIIP
ncbi:hypothetical protein CCP3SC15_1390001 [Gammaproteobacteria bacterium]